MNGKRFVWGIVGILILLISVLEYLVWFWPEPRYMGDGYAYWMWQKEYVNQNHDKKEILLLGDSRMKDAWDARSFHADAVNLALPGSPPVVMYYGLKSYLRYNQAPKAVIIAFAPTHYANMEGYTGYALYYHYLSSDEAQESAEVIYEKDGVDYRNKVIQYEYRMPNIYLQGLVRSLRGDREKRYREEYVATDERAGWQPLKGSKAGQKIMAEEAKSSQFVPLKSVTYYIKAMIELCVANNIKVYIEQLPMGEAGYDCLVKSGYLQDYQDYIRQFQIEEKVMVNVDIPVYDSEYFADNSHVNAEGAAIFTKAMREKYRHDLK